MTAMSTVVTVGSERYSIMQASAVAQRALVLSLAARLASSAASSKTPLSADMVMGVLTVCPESLVADVERHVLASARFADDPARRVTVDDFSGRITEYFKLLAVAVEFNLSDFFQYVDSAVKEALAAAQQPAPSTGT